MPQEVTTEIIMEVIVSYKPPPGSFRCESCNLKYDNPGDLGYHLGVHHNLSNFEAQSEVALIKNNLIKSLLSEEFEGHWLHDAFFITGRKKDG